MTLPIAFAPTPVAEGTDPADAEDSFGDVASVTDANFEKINLFHRTDVQVCAASTQTTGLTAPLTTRTWAPFPAEHWAPISLVLPGRCSGVMIGVGARCLHDATEPGWVGVSFLVSGATTWPMAGWHAYHSTLTNGQWMSGGVTATIAASEITPGGTLTITPYYYWESDNANPGSNVQEYFGHLWAIGFV